jgi:hypothetical protein
LTEIAQTLEAAVEEAQSLEEVRKKDLHSGDRVLVTTRNSRHTIWVLGDGLYWVSGGWFDLQDSSPLRVAIDGWGGTAIKSDIVAARGLRLQFGNTVRRMSHGVQFDFNYTCSKSIEYLLGFAHRHRAFKMPGGTVNIFRHPATAQSLFLPALPGQVGVRNFLRGNGYFGIDLVLSKRWMMPWSDKQNLPLRWEVFNVTNSTRFDFNDQNSSRVSESNNSIGVGQRFDNYTHLNDQSPSDGVCASLRILAPGIICP